MALPNEIDDWLKTHLSLQGREPAMTNSSLAARDDSEKRQDEVIVTDLLWGRPSRPADLSREIGYWANSVLLARGTVHPVLFSARTPLWIFPVF